jgi:hypothetical protein
MTFPRRLLPQQTHAVSRRCSGRRFLLRPDPFTNDVVRYAFARAKQLCPTVSLHAVVAESNHTHTGLTDARKDSTQRSSVSRRLTLPQFSGHPGYAAPPRELSFDLAPASSSKRVGLT